MDFSNKTYRDHLILSSSEKWGGGFWYVFLTFLDDLQFCLKGGYGGPPPEKFY